MKLFSCQVDSSAGVIRLKIFLPFGILALPVLSAVHRLDRRSLRAVRLTLLALPPSVRPRLPPKSRGRSFKSGPPYSQPDKNLSFHIHLREAR